MRTLLSMWLVAATALSSAAAQTTTLISVSSAGVQGDETSGPGGVSADGRFVVFASFASTLVLGDTNGDSDIFVRDTLTGLTERASVAADGSQVTGNSSYPTISADGRYVAFASDGADLVPGTVPPDGSRQIYRKDRLTGAVALVSVSPTGEPANLGAGIYSRSAISADGNVVAFESRATNLMPGTTIDQVYVRDMTTGITVCVSVSPAGEKGAGPSKSPSLSANGRRIAFSSSASNLGPVDGTPGVYGSDVFVRDLDAGTTEAVSVSSAEVPADGNSVEPFLSADGLTVAFQSLASNLAPLDVIGDDIFVRDLAAGTTVRITNDQYGGSANGNAQRVHMSRDGRWVIFQSSVENLVPDDTNGESDIFLHDRHTGITERVSVTDAGAQLEKGNPSRDGFVSDDGRRVVFDSSADALVAFPITSETHVFLRDLGPWTNEGFGLAGLSGKPSLVGQGSLQAGSPGSLALAQAAPYAPAMMFVSLSSSPKPFKGGTLVASPVVSLIALATNGAGKVALPFTWPAGIPSETALWFQVAIHDWVASSDVALSNGVKAVTP
ncbi:MAG TPA: calcium-binding protein [Planctomycetota bacterium]|nr:calcium-binding protein [Planctomycetota bacterium]